MQINDKREGDWLSTYLGIKFYPLDPREEEIFINDIARSLSMQCRFNGHTKYFYSVAEHSVLIARYLQEIGAATPVILQGLLHDATEAYLCDIPKPLKPFITNYKDIEKKLYTVIMKKYGLPEDEYTIVNSIDKRIVINEAQILLQNGTRGWTNIDDKLDNVRLPLWSPSQAETEFLNLFIILRDKMDKEQI